MDDDNNEDDDEEDWDRDEDCRQVQFPLSLINLNIISQSKALMKEDLSLLSPPPQLRICNCENNNKKTEPFKFWIRQTIMTTTRHFSLNLANWDAPFVNFMITR